MKKFSARKNFFGKAVVLRAEKRRKSERRKIKGDEMKKKPRGKRKKELKKKKSNSLRTRKSSTLERAGDEGMAFGEGHPISHSVEIPLEETKLERDSLRPAQSNSFKKEASNQKASAPGN